MLWCSLEYRTGRYRAGRAKKVTRPAKSREIQVQVLGASFYRVSTEGEFVYPKSDDQDQRYEKRKLRNDIKCKAKELRKGLKELEVLLEPLVDLPMPYLKLEDAARAVGGRAYEISRIADKLFGMVKDVKQKAEEPPCVHGHALGTPSGDLHRGCARMGSV